MASRSGSLLEKNVAKILRLSGFNPNLNQIVKGYEIDVFVKHGNKKIGIECKQYERSSLGIRNLIHQWDSKNKELNFDRIIFALVGCELSLKEKQLADKYGIIIWDENKISKLLDESIEKKDAAKKLILKEMGFKEESPVTNVGDETVPTIEKIKNEFENLVEKNKGQPFAKGREEDQLYPYYLSIEVQKEADTFGIDVSVHRVKGISILFPAGERGRLVRSTTDILNEFNFKERRNSNNLRVGTYFVDATFGVHVAFGDDLETAAEATDKVLKIAFGSDLKDSKIGFKQREQETMAERNEKLIKAFNAFEPDLKDLKIEFKQEEHKEGCFIATAAYGAPFVSEINVLRHWRDYTLLNSWAGRQFISIYYFISPPIAYIISKSEILKATVRKILKPIIVFIEKENKKVS